MSEIPATKKRTPSLYLQVVVAVVCGIALGLWKPEWATACRGLGELFVRLIKLLVTPVVYVWFDALGRKKTVAAPPPVNEEPPTALPA